MRVERGDRVTHVPTGSGDLKTGLVTGILRQLGLTQLGLTQLGLTQLGLTMRDLR